ncbi:MAG: hypothetical protein K8S16_03615, partial [Bacteroidales bacterium]|nr:hypothetical protein [Bacteroidales bacterium]
MNKRPLIIYLAGILITVSLNAQDIEEDDCYCDPRVEGMPRPVGISIKYERVLDYRIYSTSKVDEYPDGDGEIN